MLATVSINGRCVYIWIFGARNSDAFSGFTLAGKDCTGTDPVITLISLLTHAVIVQNRPHTR